MWLLLLTSAQLHIPFTSSIILEIEIVLLTLVTFPQKSFDKIFY
jgi:hypothetical protein